MSSGTNHRGSNSTNVFLNEKPIQIREISLSGEIHSIRLIQPIMQIAQIVSYSMMTTDDSSKLTIGLLTFDTSFGIRSQFGGAVGVREDDEQTTDDYYKGEQASGAE